MKIGLDISSLQGPHRMRGIGYTLINFINSLPPEIKSQHSFVFYFNTGEGHEDPLSILSLDGLEYEIRPLGSAKRITKTLPGKLHLITRLLNQILSLKDVYVGDSRINDLSGIDIFLQTDQSVNLPKGKVKKVFIAYDLIPYVLEWDYLWNYRTARSHGLPIQASVRCSGRRWLYIHKLRVNSRRADKIFAISDVTKSDFLQYIGVLKDKIITTPLGVNLPDISRASDSVKMFRYIPSSWGYLRRSYSLGNTPYILFVGGADKRRRLDELVTAFNHIRAQGHELKLVLAGDSMQGPMNISTEITQQALKDSSYLDDIIFMGFVDDEQRNWLYKNALAFIFPSKYEGFGLPVLEAFSYGCPVISYANQATVEVANNIPYYVDGHGQLMQSILDVMKLPASERSKKSEKGISQANKYTWQQTSTRMIEALVQIVSSTRN